MLFYLAMFFILLIWIAYSYYAAGGAPEEINYSTFKSEVRNGNVEEVTVQGERITGTLRQPAERAARAVNHHFRHSSSPGFIPSPPEKRARRHLPSPAAPASNQQEAAVPPWLPPRTLSTANQLAQETAARP